MKKKTPREISTDLDRLFSTKSTPPTEPPKEKPEPEGTPKTEKSKRRISWIYVIPFLAGILVSLFIIFIYPLLRTFNVSHLTINRRYSFPVYGYIVSTPVIADINDDGHMDICAADENANVFLVDAQSSKKIFQFTGDDSFISSLFYADVNGDGSTEVGALSRKGTLYIINKNGQYLYTSRREYFDEKAISKPAVINGSKGTALILAGSRGTVVSLEGRYGLLNWHNDDSQVAGREIFASPLICDVNDDDTEDVIVISLDGGISALDGLSGREIWYLKLGDRFKASAAFGTFTSGEQLLFCGLDGLLTVVSTRKGKIDWQDTIDDGLVASPAVYNDAGRDKAVLCTLNGRVLVLDAAASKVTEVYKNKKVPFRASALLTDVDRDGSKDIICVDGDGNVCLIDIKTKKLKTRIYPVGEEVSSSPLAGDIDNDRNLELVVCSEKGNIHVLGINTSPADIFPTGRIMHDQFMHDGQNRNHF